MPVVTVPIHQAIRQACVQLLTDYRQEAETRLAIYAGRPRILTPPHAFVDRIRERIEYPGITLSQRTVTAEVVIVHGYAKANAPSSTNADTVDQADVFADFFFQWVKANYHAMGAATTLGTVTMEDDPNYIPDWLPPAEQQSYYATRLELEGYAEN